MKYREKLGYIALGGVLMLVGMLTASWCLPLGAQNEAIIEEIICKRIRVVNEYGTTGIVLDTTERGGLIDLRGERGKGAFMGVSENGGIVHVRGEGTEWTVKSVDEYGYVIQPKKGSRVASMGIIKEGGYHSVSGKGGKGAFVAVDKYGGMVSVFGKGNGGARVMLWVNDFGSGSVNTWDKNGNSLARLR